MQRFKKSFNLYSLLAHRSSSLALALALSLSVVFGSTSVHAKPNKQKAKATSQTRQALAHKQKTAKQTKAVSQHKGDRKGNTVAKNTVPAKGTGTLANKLTAVPPSKATPKSTNDNRRIASESGGSAPLMSSESSGGGSLGAVGGADRAVEVRGQARTLSMMLVLRNGKENINFIKPRTDYNAEISNTQF